MIKIYSKKIICFLLLICIICGCSQKQESNNITKYYDHLIIVYGAHSNAPSYDLSVIENDIMNTCLNYGTIEIIISDGNPNIEERIKIPEQDKGLSNSKKKNIAKKQTEQIITYVSSLYAQEKEVNLLSSLILAGKQFDKKESNKLIVIDNGIQTLNPLNMTTSGLNIDIDNTIDTLKKEQYIPDLDGVVIDFWGIGNVNSPQEQPSPKEIENLVSLWKGIINESTNQCIVYENNIANNKKQKDNLPYVTPVPISVSKNTINIKNSYIAFDDKSLGFISDTSSFINEDKTTKILEEVITQLKDDKQLNITIVGTTAKWGTRESCIKLSQERAHAVSQILIKNGIEKSRIQEIGVGYESDFYQNEKNKDGSLNDKMAQQNRKVIIMDSNNAKAKLLVKKWNK